LLETGAEIPAIANHPEAKVFILSGRYKGEGKKSVMTITGKTQLSLSQWLSPSTPSPSQSSPSKPQSVVSSQMDSVQITNFVKAALQEATEPPEQTANEARNGDPQAQRLLAKEAAEEKASAR
jgi:hypothetical protein